MYRLEACWPRDVAGSRRRHDGRHRDGPYHAGRSRQLAGAELLAVRPALRREIPPCDSGWVLSDIRGNFGTKERRFWNSDLSIVDVGEVRQVAFRPWAEATVPRRWCSGKVLVSDGKWRPVHYSIVESGGAIGASWGVEWCVVGLDRNWAYNPRCKMARP